jgi:hypothetical protein
MTFDTTLRPEEQKIAAIVVLIVCEKYRNASKNLPPDSAPAERAAGIPPSQ